MWLTSFGNESGRNNQKMRKAEKFRVHKMTNNGGAIAKSNGRTGEGSRRWNRAGKPGGWDSALSPSLRSVHCQLFCVCLFVFQ